MMEDDKGKQLERALEEGRDWWSAQLTTLSSASGTRGAMPEPSVTVTVTVGLRSRRLRRTCSRNRNWMPTSRSHANARELAELGHANILSVRALERE
jgi:hypothetical protein